MISPESTPDLVASALGATSVSSTSTVKEDHNIDLESLALFVQTKMNATSIGKLWQHMGLQAGFIEKDQIENLLILIGVLYIAFQYKSQGILESPKIDKNRLKDHFSDLHQWIVKTKMHDNNTKISQDDFQKTVGGWLQEFASQRKTQ